MDAHQLALLLPTQAGNAALKWKALLNSAMAWLGPSWRMAAVDLANIFIVPYDGSPESLGHWQQCNQAHPKAQFIAATHLALPEAQWTLPIATGEGLPSLMGLVNLLLRVGEFLDRQNGSVDLALDEFQLQDHIQSILIEAQMDLACRICEFDNVKLYLVPGQNLAYAPGGLENLVPICIAHVKDIRVSVVDEAEIHRKSALGDFNGRLSKYAVLDDSDLLETIVAKKPQSYPLDELLWFASLVNSKGRLMPEQDYGLHFKLKALPDFFWQDRYQAYHSLARLWAGDFWEISAFSALAQAPWRQVIDFHNACALLDGFESQYGGSAAAPLESMAAENVRQEDEVQVESEPLLFLVPAQSPMEDLATSVMEELYSAFQLEGTQSNVKIIFAGMQGAGKTRAIATVSECVRQATGHSDKSLFNRGVHKVAVNFAELHLRDLKFYLYGTPGLRRLEFMGQSLCAGAWGLVVMIDNSADHPLDELDYYLDLYHDCSANLRVAIAVTHFDKSSSPSLEDYQAHLDRYHFGHPAWVLDPRSQPAMLDFLTKMAGLETGRAIQAAEAA
jgi:signal recognition particle receptor subunit beta